MTISLTPKLTDFASKTSFFNSITNSHSGANSNSAVNYDSVIGANCDSQVITDSGADFARGIDSGGGSRIGSRVNSGFGSGLNSEIGSGIDSEHGIGPIPSSLHYTLLSHRCASRLEPGTNPYWKPRPSYRFHYLHL